MGGGPLFIITEVRDTQGNMKKYSVGAKANVAGGFRWRYIGVSAGISYLYLPSVPGFKHSLQAGGRLAFTFDWP